MTLILKTETTKTIKNLIANTNRTQNIWDVLSESSLGGELHFAGKPISVWDQALTLLILFTLKGVNVKQYLAIQKIKEIKLK